MASIDALIGALHQFAGTLIFISHDVYFIRQLAKHVLHVDSGKLTHYHGDYQYYLDKSAATRPVIAAPAAPPKNPAPTKDQKRREAQARQARADQRKVAEALEAEIARLEARQVELTAELELPATYEQPGRAVEVNRQLTGITEALTRTIPEWEEAAARLNEL
jgi:ATP-binding cassette subfamily F protein 3